MVVSQDTGRYSDSVCKSEKKCNLSMVFMSLSISLDQASGTSPQVKLQNAGAL